MNKKIRIFNLKEDNIIPIKNISSKKQNILPKPSWVRVKISNNSSTIKKVKNILYKKKLNSVCEEASCPNITECFNNGIVTFMILGKICTRKCTFCDVEYGRPEYINDEEPKNLAEAVVSLSLKHVVITSVNRDDLRDGGAQQFAKCINEIRKASPSTIVEILVPDFRGRIDFAINIINRSLPDIFNHNIESVPRIHNKIRPGGGYEISLKLLRNFKKNNPKLPTKSGLMLGLGETKEEIVSVMNDLYKSGVTMITLGQYLQPSKYHTPVVHYLTKDEFKEIKREAIKIGFPYVSCGTFVRSSYYADLQFRKLNFIR